MFVIAVDHDGVEFWGGTPRRPSMRCRLDRQIVVAVSSGPVAIFPRSVPGVILHVMELGRDNEIDFAICRRPPWTMWAQLNEAKVEETAGAIRTALGKDV